MPQLIDSPVGPVNNAAATVQVAPAPLTAAKYANTINHSHSTPLNSKQNYSSPISSKVLNLLHESTPLTTSAVAVPAAPALSPATTFIKPRENMDQQLAQIIAKKASLNHVPQAPVIKSKSRSSPAAAAAAAGGDLSMKDSVDQLMKKAQLLEDSDVFYGGRSGFYLRRNIISRNIKSQLKSQEASLESLEAEPKVPWYKRMANSIQKKFSSSKSTPVVAKSAPAAVDNDVSDDEWHD